MSAVRFGRTLMQHSRWLLLLVLLPGIIAWWSRRKDKAPPTAPPQP